MFVPLLTPRTTNTVVAGWRVPTYRAEHGVTSAESLHYNHDQGYSNEGCASAKSVFLWKSFISFRSDRESGRCSHVESISFEAYACPAAILSSTSETQTHNNSKQHDRNRYACSNANHWTPIPDAYLRPTVKPICPVTTATTCISLIRARRLDRWRRWSCVRE